MLNQETVKMGDTTVEISKKNGVVFVNILSNDAVISRNGDLLWSKGNEKEEFQHFSPIFHSFFTQYHLDHLNFDPKEKRTEIDVTIENSNLTFYIPENRKKSITVRFDFIDTELAEDYILSLDFDKDKQEQLKSELHTQIKNFKEYIQEKGWKFAYSHSSGDWAYAWADAIFFEKDWNEQVLIDVAKKIDEFDQYVQKLYDTLMK